MQAAKHEAGELPSLGRKGLKDKLLPESTGYTLESALYSFHPSTSQSRATRKAERLLAPKRLTATLNAANI